VDLCVNSIKKQIDIIHPEVICCLGDTAVRAFLKQDNSISVLRGRFHDYKGIKVMATFDPGLLLSEPEKKRDV
jgi:DNA polymerase